MKKVYVTGAGGYIGILLCEELLNRGYSVIAMDRFFFGKDKISYLQGNPNLSIVMDDIRDVDTSLLKDVDAVIDLAGLSNDASSEIDPKLTQDINLDGATNFAKSAKINGVKRYIYSSSASVYGAGETQFLDETSSLAPQTEYAKAKVGMEKNLQALNDDKFEVVYLRNATVYGLAPRMRFDLVINIMTSRALKERVIYIMGGGKQWRPLVHVRDVIQAMLLALEAPKEIVSGEIFNVGSDTQNYQIEELSSFVMDVIPNVKLHVIPDAKDLRSYHLSFKKILNVLNFVPKVGVHEGVVEIKQALEKGQVQVDDPTCYTLQWYKALMEWEQRLAELKHNGFLLKRNA